MTNIINNDIILYKYYSEGKKLAQEELMFVLDYILNKCSSKELAAIEQAINKRKNDSYKLSINPEDFAKKISNAVNESIAAGIKGMQNSIKNMAYGLIKKDSPDLSEEEINKVVQMMVPDVFEKKHSVAADYLKNGISLLDKDNKVNGFPCDAMRQMVCAFVNYSFGTLRPEEDRALQNASGEWQKVYWQAFPEPLQDLIRQYLKNNLPDEAFVQAIDVLLPENEENNKTDSAL